MVRVAGLYSQIKQEVDSLSSDGLTPDEQMSEVILETNNRCSSQYFQMLFTVFGSQMVVKRAIWVVILVI